MGKPLAHHYGPFKPRKGWSSSRIYLSDHAPRSLIFLVHGFKSKSKQTWPFTDAQILDDVVFGWSDIVVWDYNSFTGNIPKEVANLHKAINFFWNNSEYVVRKQWARHKFEHDGPPSKYQRVILIGYSLGAYLVRSAALTAALQPTAPPWLADLHVGLFAPAHCGAPGIDYFKTDGGLMDGFKNWMRRNTVRAADVLVPGSSHLQKLRSRTELFARTHGALAARYILFGDDEAIVNVDKFHCDTVAITTSAGKHHGNVQKANDVYLQPVSEIQALLP